MEKYQNLWLTVSLPNVYYVYVMFSSKAVCNNVQSLYTLQRKISFRLFTQFLNLQTLLAWENMLWCHNCLPRKMMPAWGTTAEIQCWQGCTLAELSGPWSLIFAPWQLENLSCFKESIYWVACGENVTCKKLWVNGSNDDGRVFWSSVV